MRRLVTLLFVRHPLTTAIVGFILCALIGGAVRGLRYDFGNTKGADLIVAAAQTPSPSPSATAFALNGYVNQPNCTVTLYGDQAPIARSTPAPPLATSASSNPAHAAISPVSVANARFPFSFSVPETLWGSQNQIVAECPHFPRVTRGVVAVVLPSSIGSPSDPRFFSGIRRTIHFVISPGRTRFHGVIELPESDPRLTAALGLSSLEQLAREAFNVNFNFHPLYDALRDPTLQIYKEDAHVFLTLKGELYSYATIAGPSNISIVVSPIELVRAGSLGQAGRHRGSDDVDEQCSRDRLWCSKIVVGFRGFNATSFPRYDPNGFSQSLGPPPQLTHDGSYVWYTPVSTASSQSVQITVRPYALISPTDFHHFFAAAARVADPLIGSLVNILHSLVGVAIVVVLLSYAGFWRHDDAHERYCGVLVAAALASVLIGAGFYLARCLFYLLLYFPPVGKLYLTNFEKIRPLLGFILQSLEWTFVAAILGAVVCVYAIVHYLRQRNVMKKSRYFLTTAAAIFAISFFGSLYSLVELFGHYSALSDPKSLNSAPLTIFSDAALAITLFSVLMVSFQPHLAVHLFRIKFAARRWGFWIVALLFALAAAIVLPSSAYFSADYAVPEFRVDTALTEAGPYISSLAVVVPILWFLWTSKRAILKTVQEKWHLALLFATLAILTGYSYLGFPLTLALTVVAVYAIALRPGASYDAISKSLQRRPKQATLLAESTSIDSCVAASLTQERLLQQFVGGTLSRADYERQHKELDAFIKENTKTVKAGNRSQAMALAFGTGLESHLLANARFCALLSVTPGVLLTILSATAIVGNLPAVHVPFFVTVAQVISSVLGYMAAGLGFGLAFPYLRGNIGTVKALWVIFALGIAILPYEFMSGSRVDYLAQVLRWLIFFGTLGLTTDLLSTLRWKRRLNVKDFFNMAGVGNFAAVGAVAATILTSLLTTESRALLDTAIHHVVPAQYALPTAGPGGQSPTGE